MKRREFIASSVAMAAAAPVAAEAKPSGDYAILCEYTLYRGGALAFDLKSAVKKAGSLGQPDSVAIMVCYRDGREVELDWRKLTRPGKTREQVREGIIENAKRSLATYEDPARRHMLMSYNSPRFAEEWRRQIENGPTDEEIDESLPYSDAKYLSDSELDEIERNGFIAVAYAE